MVLLKSPETQITEKLLDHVINQRDQLHAQNKGLRRLNRKVRRLEEEVALLTEELDAMEFALESAATQSEEDAYV